MLCALYTGGCTMLLIQRLCSWHIHQSEPLFQNPGQSLLCKSLEQIKCQVLTLQVQQCSLTVATHTAHLDIMVSHMPSVSLQVVPPLGILFVHLCPLGVSVLSVWVQCFVYLQSPPSYCHSACTPATHPVIKLLQNIHPAPHSSLWQLLQLTSVVITPPILVSKSS